MIAAARHWAGVVHPAPPAAGRAGPGRWPWPQRSPRGRPASRAVGLSAGGTNSTVMVGETRIERRVDRWIDRATTPRAAALVIAVVTRVTTVVAGLLMTVIDHDSFPSLGGGLWWAIQTVTTVGYGDHVPESAGRPDPGGAGHAPGDRLHHGGHRGDHQYVRRSVGPAGSGPEWRSVGGELGGSTSASGGSKPRCASAGRGLWPVSGPVAAPRFVATRAAGRPWPAIGVAPFTPAEVKLPPRGSGSPFHPGAPSRPARTRDVDRGRPHPAGPARRGSCHRRAHVAPRPRPLGAHAPRAGRDVDVIEVSGAAVPTRRRAARPPRRRWYRPSARRAAGP